MLRGSKPQTPRGQDRHTEVQRSRGPEGATSTAEDISIICISLTRLQIKPRAHLLHLGLPLPLHRVLALAARPADALVDPAQLERRAGPQFLQAGADLFDALELLAVGADHALLGGALVAEHVAVPTQEDVIALVVQRDDLAALELWVVRPEVLKRLCREDTERGAEVVEQELGLCLRVSTFCLSLSLARARDLIVDCCNLRSGSLGCRGQAASCRGSTC